ncbi:helix-turn-helix transcriptional regulator [Ellagibacter isourolithinifaciens]|uniref:helix-turn-helix transcriptional regulator n=1 Tax=Ellagibacter isourolithinifaciens TaxID=2137581 RepID=UPI002E79E199|nr:LuxR C-terminal-related transcriptional regulator [Ellagibacter isourolithinifaciens]MEE0246642.1 LuxR C-terminal-related transcriptional regulator [Ellagibacter isourolithinifaciens]
MIGKTNQSSPSPLCAPNQKTPSEKATPASEQSENVGAKITRHKPLAWSILGLALCRAGLIVGSYGSYRHSDEGIYSDGVMLVALAILAVLWLLIAITKCHLSRQVVRRVAFASIILEAFSLTMTGVLVIGPPEMNVAGNHFLASTFCTLGGLACMSYWLRRARDCTAITAVIYAFGALFVSELLIFTSIFMKNGISYFYAAVLVLLQFPCILLARTKPLACDIKTLSNKGDFFNFTKNTMTSKVFLATICVSIGVLACADGFLRGYPDGLPIAFRATTRFADLVLILAFCVAIIVFTCRQHHRVMTVGIFVTMEALACIALLCYSAWPDALDIGAIFTTNLNALLVGFSWYIILAFMSYGWRCPYYYAIAGWIVWLGCRGIARITLINVTAVSQNDLLMLAAVFTMIVISTQVAFVNFLNVRKFEAVPEEELTHQQKAVQTSPVVKIMGLDDHHESLADVRQATMRHNAEEVGKQFLLSEREVEVLSLYALGWTQKRVAEELFISPGTAHAHIKRIYAKTGLHSRQEILDYMEKYTS